jgi:hypothetical protein
MVQEAKGLFDFRDGLLQKSFKFRSSFRDVFLEVVDGHQLFDEVLAIMLHAGSSQLRDAFSALYDAGPDATLSLDDTFAEGIPGNAAVKEVGLYLRTLDGVSSLLPRPGQYWAGQLRLTFTVRLLLWNQSGYRPTTAGSQRRQARPARESKDESRSRRSIGGRCCQIQAAGNIWQDKTIGMPAAGAELHGDDGNLRGSPYHVGQLATSQRHRYTTIRPAEQTQAQHGRIGQGPDTGQCLGGHVSISEGADGRLCPRQILPARRPSDSHWH